MVGKTNLTFISKGETSSVQLIQKSYVTGATGRIYKMEMINNIFFVFSDNYRVLSGLDMNNLKFIQKDNAPLKATHIVYADDRYYIMDASSGNQLYVTYDFEEYEEITILEDIDKLKNAGIFLNSSGKIVLSYIKPSNTTMNNNRIMYIKIFMCDSLKDISTWYESGETQIGSGNISCYDSFMVDDRIYVGERQVSLSGDNNYIKSGLKRYMYAYGYFFYTDYNTSEDKCYLYRSRNGENFIRYNYELTQISSGGKCVIPIDGKYGLLYRDKNAGECYLNITDDMFKIGLTENDTILVYDDIDVTSVLEHDGKTYLGTISGVIYEYQLNYDGMLQRPDVTVIKTLAAKQALAQALQYTDDSIKELKNYIDKKIGEKVLAEESSTEVEV